MKQLYPKFPMIISTPNPCLSFYINLNLLSCKNKLSLRVIYWFVVFSIQFLISYIFFTIIFILFFNEINFWFLLQVIFASYILFWIFYFWSLWYVICIRHFFDNIYIIFVLSFGNNKISIANDNWPMTPTVTAVRILSFDYVYNNVIGGHMLQGLQIIHIWRLRFGPIRSPLYFEYEFQLFAFTPMVF